MDKQAKFYLKANCSQKVNIAKIAMEAKNRKKRVANRISISPK